MNGTPQVIEILQTNTRIDGRRIGEIRDIALTFLTSRGSVLVEKGKTKVSASSKLGVLSGEQLKTGRVIVTCNLAPDLKETVEHVNLSEILSGTFSGDQIVPKDTLVIIPGAVYFTIHCIVEVLQDDGGLRDTCIIAAGTSIYHMGIPNIRHLRGSGIDISSKKQIESFTKEVLALSRDELVTMKYIPLSVTFGHLNKRKLMLTELSSGAYAEGDYTATEDTGTSQQVAGVSRLEYDYLIDCCREELELCEGCTTIVLDKSGLTNGLYKLAGAPISPQNLVQMTVEAHEAVRQAATDIETAVVADIEARKSELKARVRN